MGKAGDDTTGGTDAPLRVLMVEDDDTVRWGIEALLEMEGMVVHCVSTGGEAVDAISRFEPDLVVLDVRLPDTSGLEVYDAIASRWPSLPVIFSSGHADHADLEEQLSVPHVGFLRKPYAIDLLFSEIHRRVSDANR